MVTVALTDTLPAVGDVVGSGVVLEIGPPTLTGSLNDLFRAYPPARSTSTSPNRVPPIIVFRLFPVFLSRIWRPSLLCYTL